MFSEKIKIALVKKSMTKTELADKINVSVQNLHGLLKRDNMTEKQMSEIAEALNCQLTIKLKLDTGEEL